MLAERHTVVALDLRGLGDSDPGTQPNDVPTDADDLHTLVAELGLGPVLVAGQDWGGSAVFAFAAAYPDEVRRLAVLESKPAGGRRVRGPDLAASRLSDEPSASNTSNCPSRGKISSSHCTW
jgi:pimeloyl-ACP methyl ester carboxylesterase